MSRGLACKTSLAVRVDALGEDENTEMGLEHRAKLEMRLRHLEEGGVSSPHTLISVPIFIHTYI